MRGAWWWIDRWRKSTAYTDMTLEEQGAYRNLLDELWLREGHVIPDDDRILARVAGADREVWARVKGTVLRWMKRVDGGWTHETALEVIHQSTRRAANQAAYRQRGRRAIDNAPDNAHDNAPITNPITRRSRADNKPDNEPASPSPFTGSTYYPNGLIDRQTDLLPSAAIRSNGSSGGKANPLVTGRRTELERETLNLSSEIGTLTDQDPAEVLAHAAHYDGARRTKVNPATMTDDRLMNTVMDLRATLKAEREKGDRSRPRATA